MMNPPLLIVPGWQNSEPGHWQSIWEKKLNATRVLQDEWMNPQRSEWVSRLAETVKIQSTPPVLIAHSLGCMTTAILSAETDCKIAGAFLVGPLDLEQPSTPRELVGFLPTPMEKLRFPSILVGSTNDSYCTIEKAALIAKAWGSEFINLGPKGHIHVPTGFGEWPSGLDRLLKFVSADIR